MNGPEQKNGRAARVILVLAAILALLAGGYMGVLHSRPGPKIVLVGMDALTWDIMDPLLEQGKLPNFQKLMDRGAHAELGTMKSTYISASIWTTILTGKHPKHHGIEGFFTTRGYPVNSSHRTTKYLAQILGGQGVTSSSVGFWATWPAEEIDGYVVSDLASYGRFKDASKTFNERVNDYSYLKEMERVTWPPDLLGEILPVMLSPGEVPRSVYEEVLPMADAEWERFKKIGRVSRKNDLSLLKFAVVTDYNFHRAGLEIIKDHGPEAYMVYFQGPDILEHFFWQYREPDIFGHVTEEQAEKYGGAIDNYYMFMDRLLGEIVAAADEDALIIVCSDHGQKKVRHWGQDGLHSGEHRLSKPAGIIILAGPGVKDSDARLEGPYVYDVVPTLLYLRGLPIGEDMDGKIFMGAVEDSFQETHKVRMIPTHDDDSVKKEEVFSPLDDEIKERLRAIGYID